MGSPAISDAHCARARAMISALTCGLSAATAGVPIINNSAIVPAAAPRDQFVSFNMMCPPLEKCRGDDRPAGQTCPPRAAGKDAVGLTWVRVNLGHARLVWSAARHPSPRPIGSLALQALDEALVRLGKS